MPRCLFAGCIIDFQKNCCVWERILDRGTRLVGPGYDVKLHPVSKAQFSTIEVLVALPMTLGV